MPQPISPPPTAKGIRSHWMLASLMAAAAALMAACKAAPEPPGVAPDHRTPRTNAADTKTPASVSVAMSTGAARSSTAATPRAYRRDAAAHLYALNTKRIFKGKLAPHLYAIGVLDVDIDRTGRVTRIKWLRAPRHAPEVIAEIERTIRAAAPFPVPVRMGKVTYTETWLWDKSGRFQLDTLTEGQL